MTFNNRAEGRSNYDTGTKHYNCRTSRICQARFWCGFCVKLIDLRKEGREAWDKRFDYINGHFMGYRGLLKQGIQDWVPIDSGKSKGDVGSPLLVCRGRSSMRVRVHWIAGDVIMI
jgi:hypothetical protein